MGYSGGQGEEGGGREGRREGKREQGGKERGKEGRREAGKGRREGATVLKYSRTEDRYYRPKTAVN